MSFKKVLRKRNLCTLNYILNMLQNYGNWRKLQANSLLVHTPKHVHICVSIEKNKTPTFREAVTMFCLGNGGWRIPMLNFYLFKIQDCSGCTDRHQCYWLLDIEVCNSQADHQELRSYFKRCEHVHTHTNMRKCKLHCMQNVFTANTSYRQRKWFKKTEGWRSNCALMGSQKVCTHRRLPTELGKARL